jgi:hypothetical protein
VFTDDLDRREQQQNQRQKPKDEVFGLREWVFHRTSGGGFALGTALELNPSKKKPPFLQVVQKRTT